MLVLKERIFLHNSTKVFQFLTWAVCSCLLPRGGVVETRPGEIKLRHKIWKKSLKAKGEGKTLPATTNIPQKKRKSYEMKIKMHLWMKHKSDINLTEHSRGANLTKWTKLTKTKYNGGRPINQRRTWNQDQSQKKKELLKKNWFAKGGYDVPLFVPHTPGGELAKRMRKAEAQNHQGRKIRFKIVEKGGVTLEKMLRRSNPWSSENCGRADCFPCQGGEGGTCWREGVTYTVFCVECGEKVAAYFGESGRNAFTRGKEHTEKYNAKDEENSVL